jgi:hypothetical protein
VYRRAGLSRIVFLFVAPPGMAGTASVSARASHSGIGIGPDFDHEPFEAAIAPPIDRVGKVE